MDPAPPGTTTNPPRTAAQLPPAALALAARFFDAARKGHMDLFEQALPRRMSPNLTNDKGDSLVRETPSLQTPSSSNLVLLWSFQK